MKNHEIERWVLEIIDRVRSGQPVEDSRVELKSGWIDSKKAARRIAGHANAAHGESILWVVGIDEKKQAVPGAHHVELSTWWPQVEKQFDGLAPEFVDLVIPVDGVSLVALLISTGRAPYVVKNQNPGTSTPREVPYRTGTRVDSATRSQLLRILSPIVDNCTLGDHAASAMRL